MGIKVASINYTTIWAQNQFFIYIKILLGSAKGKGDFIIKSPFVRFFISVSLFCFLTLGFIKFYKAKGEKKG